MPQGNSPSTPDSLAASGQYEIDRTALKRLRDDCGDDIVEVVAVFADELQSFLDDMDHAAAAGDLARLCGTALSIRGCAATFGLHNVRQASAGLEAACRMGKPSQARQISIELHAAADQALKALRSEFPTRLP